MAHRNYMKLQRARLLRLQNLEISYRTIPQVYSNSTCTLQPRSEGSHYKGRLQLNGIMPKQNTTLFTAGRTCCTVTNSSSPPCTNERMNTCMCKPIFSSHPLFSPYSSNPCHTYSGGTLASACMLPGRSRTTSLGGVTIAQKVLTINLLLLHLHLLPPFLLPTFCML